MKKIAFLLSAALLFAFNSCGDDDSTTSAAESSEESSTEDADEDDSDGDSTDETNVSDSNSDFARGADISWYTEMAADGMKFYNSAGTETACPALMKELGMNAVRLRVWVNPENADCDYCNLTDVQAKAVEATEAGLDILIDFHYSDRWADPSTQETPAAWEEFSLVELQDAVATHTSEVLTALKSAGVTPKWIQIGNETRNGMLHPTGQLWDSNGGGNYEDGWANFVSLYTAGYTAAKEVVPEAYVMPHLNTASKTDDNAWWLEEFSAAGAAFDMIGLSHYPQTDDTSSTPTSLTSTALTNIQSLAKTYGVPVMVVEFGVKTEEDEETAATLASEFMTAAKKLGTDVCAGIFYWEPEVYGWWKPASYTTFYDNWSAYSMGAFLSDGSPSSVLDAWAE